jgi:hypothetical protein
MQTVVRLKLAYERNYLNNVKFGYVTLERSEGSRLQSTRFFVSLRMTLEENAASAQI